MRWAAAARSAAALVGVLLLFGVCAVFQRLVLARWLALAPRKRVERVGAYMRWVSQRVFDLMRLGGGRFRRSGRLPDAGPALVVMNHQSLLDIPTAILLCGRAAPCFVTRRRFARVPFVGSLLRLSDAALVDPERAPGQAVRSLLRATRDLDRALVIYPEGERTLKGELGPFQTAGLRAILRERRLPVYLAVTDGFWHCRALGNFLRIDRLDGRTELLGPLEPPEGGKEIDAFVAGLRHRVAGELARLRRDG